MRLKFIQNLIDTIDPYFLVKDMGFQILDEQTDKRFTNTDKEKLIPNDFYGCALKGQIIRILPCGYLNVSALLSKDIDNTKFIAGTAIDLLAFYMRGDYDKAFSLFFKNYRSMLQTKIKHDSVYIEKLIKPMFLKRHEVLHVILNKLFKASASKSELSTCNAWMSKNSIESTNNTCFFEKSVEIERLLKFLANPAALDYDEYKNDGDLDSGCQFGEFVNKHLYRDSDQWVVVPYFGDYHYVNSLKLINPVNNESFDLKIGDARLGYAGLYALNPKINFLGTKIRFFAENPIETLTMSSYSKKMLNDNIYNYVSIHLDPSGTTIKSNVSAISKPIFLHKPVDTDYPVIKAFYDTLNTKNTEQGDLFICDYNNYKENIVVHRYESFLIEEFKKITQTGIKSGSNAYFIQIGYIFNVFDINSMSIKQQIMKWLIDMNYVEVFHRLNQKSPSVHDFKSYAITATENGYLCKHKADVNGTNDIALTNFIIKIDQNIVFPDTDDILHQGRIISGNTLEYPISFYKSEIRNHSTALETIALKAFTAMNSHISVLDDTVTVTMPIIFDPSYNSSLFNILNHEIANAPIKYGSVNVGWDKTNNKFTSLSWQAQSLNFISKKQHIYAMTVSSKNGIPKDIQNCYSNLPMSCLDYGENYEFLNKPTKDLICILLASLYRTYLGYNIVPFKINDTVYARNLVKFVYAALGQIKPYEVTPNTRVLRQNKMFNSLNRYPIYVRSSNPEDLLKHCKDYPYMIFLKKQDVEDEDELYTITQALSKDGYKKVTKFVLDTLSRFFKWMFMLTVEELDLPNQECESQEQLIEEGNMIFSHLWWDKIQKECTKDILGIPALKDALRAMTLKQFYQYCYYHAEKDCYVMRMVMMPEHILTAAQIAHKALNREGKSKKDMYYAYINKEAFEEAIEGIFLADEKVPSPEHMKIFLSKSIDRSEISELHKFQKKVRTVTREEYELLV